MTTPAPKLQLTDDEWRKKLTSDEFAVLRRAGTERPFTGEYTDSTTQGVYECRACGTELFRSSENIAAGLLSSTRPTPTRSSFGPMTHWV
jgi:peptide-methionine (R)-S-oxide reductase